MSRRPRRNRKPAFKGDKTLADLAQQFDGHPNQITRWTAQLQEGAAGVFGAEPRSDAQAPPVDLKSLHAKIGELALENDFCPARSARPGTCQRL
jgi:transposase-like protein